MRSNKIMTLVLACSLMLTTLSSAANAANVTVTSNIVTMNLKGGEKPKPTVNMADFVDSLPFYLDDGSKDCDKPTRALYGLQVGDKTVEDFELESVTSNNNKATVKKEGSKWMVYPKKVGDFTLILKIKETDDYQSVTHEVPCVVLPKSPKSVKVTSPQKGQVKVTWKNPGGINKVKIGIEAKGEAYKLYTVNAGKQTYTIKKLASGKKYEVTVYGTKGSLYSSKVITKKVTVKK